MTSKKTFKLEINEKFAEALHLMENSDRHLFVTGKAGTGKSTLLEKFRTDTTKKIAVLAPTGVAALNVKGQTIHSFFKFKPDITLQTVKKVKPNDKNASTYKNLDTLIIDEISMVRADLLDCVEKFLCLNGKDKNLPFGGVQMIFIGDLYQLPPVIVGIEKKIFQEQYETPYFFSAYSLNNVEFEIVELEKIYRQKDINFIDLLNSIRNNSITETGLKDLNSRVQTDFEDITKDFYIYLTTTNRQADEINSQKLLQNKNLPQTLTGHIVGNFDDKYLPSAVDLELKIGAQVMMLNNDSARRWVNGSIGKISDIKEELILDDDDDDISGQSTTVVTVKLNDGSKIKVTPYTWEIFNFQFNPASSELESKIVGSFTQYPLKLAWAITIHKSQGKTFDKVILDIGSGAFAHGQVYVALSRCTNFEGLILKKPIAKHHIIMDYKVSNFMTNYQYQKAENVISFQNKTVIIKDAIENQSTLEITYLKANDTKSHRLISPRTIGEMSYHNKNFQGIEAYCHTSKEMRYFRIDRILTIKTLSDDPSL